MDRKRVFNHADLDVVGPDAVNGDDIEAAGMVEAIGPGQVVERHRGDAALLPMRYRLGAVTKDRRPPCLDFDKDQLAAVLGDDVNFSIASAVAPGKNYTSPVLELPDCEVFALFSEVLPIC